MNEEPARPRRFQFTMLGILVATLWSSVFACALMLLNDVRRHHDLPIQSLDAAYFLVGLLLFVSLPAAIYGLFGRASRGMFLGVLLFILFLLTLNNWGGSGVFSRFSP